MAQQRRKVKRVRSENLSCFFCENKLVPSYKDYKTLTKFISDRARIMSTEKTGVCSRHQRVLSREIKRARHLALLPYVEKIR